MGVIRTFVSLFVLLSADKSMNAKLAGPYDIQVFDLGECPQNEVPIDGTGSFHLMGIIHHNKSVDGYVFSGNATLFDNVGYKLMTRVKTVFSKWDSVSGWRPNFLSLNFGDLCFLVDHVVSDLANHLHRTIRNFPAKCPLINGFFVIDNVPAKFGHLKRFPELPYGRFRMDFHFFHLQKVKSELPFACIRVSVDIVPRLKPK